MNKFQITLLVSAPAISKAVDNNKLIRTDKYDYINNKYNSYTQFNIKIIHDGQIFGCGCG